MSSKQVTADMQIICVCLCVTRHGIHESQAAGFVSFTLLTALRLLYSCAKATCVSLFSLLQSMHDQQPAASLPIFKLNCMFLNVLFYLEPPAMQIRAQSENDADDELLSVAVMKGDKKVVAGTQSGVVNLYSWGHIDDCSDRFPGALAVPPLLCLC